MIDHDQNDVPPRDVAGVPDTVEPSGFVPTLGDRLRDLGADPRVAVAVLVAVVLVAGVLWYRSESGDPTGAATEPPSEAMRSDKTSSPSNDAAATASGEAREAAPGDAGSASPEPTGDIVVHVAGAVTRPGVVRVPPGSRVGDAVEAAGGAVGDADLDRLNLAAVVDDGQRILVARRGDPPSASPEVSDGGGTGDTGGSASNTDGPVNINEADAEDLEELPGIGPVLAEAIIDERESRGGFRSINELRDVRGIGEKRFEDLQDRVTL